MCECTTKENVLKNVNDRNIELQWNKRSYMYADVHVPDTRVVRMSKQKKMANGLSVILERLTNDSSGMDPDPDSCSWRWRSKFVPAFLKLDVVLWTWCPSLPFDDSFIWCWDVLMTSVCQVSISWFHRLSMTMISNCFWCKSCLLVATFEARGKHQCFFYIFLNERSALLILTLVLTALFNIYVECLCFDRNAH